MRKSTLRLLIMILPAAAVAAGTVRAEPFLWQTNSGGTDIHVYGIEDFQLVRRLEVGPEPHGIAAPSDGRVVYVSLEANGRDHGELLWINPRTFVIEHRLKVGPEPHAIATTPDGKWIYVPCRDGHYWVVDAEAKRVVKQIYTGGRPHNTQASSDGRYMYLSPMGRPKGVTVVDIPAQHAIVGFIPFAESVRPSALSRDGRLLFQHVDGLNGFQAAETSQRKVVATVTHSSTLGWLMPLKRLGYLSTGGFKRCHGLAVRPVDEELWSVCAEYLAIHRLEPPTFTETALVELPAKAYWLTFSLDGRYAFIALSDQNQVAVMDAAKKQIVRRLAAGWAPKRNLVLAR